MVASTVIDGTKNYTWLQHDWGKTSSVRLYLQPANTLLSNDLTSCWKTHMFHANTKNFP